MSEESNQFNFRFQCQTKILETDLEMELKFQATRISVCRSKAKLSAAQDEWLKG